MSDDDLKTMLRGAADRRTYPRIDVGPLIERADRIRRRRRWGAGTAVAIAVSLILAAPMTVKAINEPEPPVTFSGTPMPGVGRGDEALAKVTGAEAMRRCELQWSTTLGRPVKGEVLAKVGVDTRPVQPGAVIMMVSQDEQGMFDCAIPGDTAPSAADLDAFAEPDPPTEQGEILRRCSTRFWHDLSSWTVQSISVEPGLASGLIALSPSGKYVVKCFLTAPKARSQLWDKSGIEPVRPAPKGLSELSPLSKSSQMIFDRAIQLCARKPDDCRILLPEAGRVPRNVAKLHVQTNTATYEVPVRDGWFVYTIGRNNEPFEHVAVKVSAYDATGRNLGPVRGWPLDLRGTG
ncbi:hypothetical protein [Kribbella deserti]|uniref:PASTA domain-containing protein n=1 Tax=Kribbella deserti TaxID=1926257 RepID=A0ABV6QIX9_9ACTN